jgi:hypothetical protein
VFERRLTFVVACRDAGLRPAWALHVNSWTGGNINLSLMQKTSDERPAPVRGIHYSGWLEEWTPDFGPKRVRDGAHDDIWNGRGAISLRHVGQGKGPITGLS